MTAPNKTPTYRQTDGDSPHLTKADWVRAALERYEQPLLRYAARITGDVERARDVVQFTFMRLWEAERGKVDGHLTGWLYTVCRNRARDVRRKERRMNPLGDTQAAVYPSPKPGPDAAAVGNETHAIVMEVIDGLSDSHQEAFRLRFDDDLTYREIAEIMGVSLGKVSKLVTTALEALRARLRAETDLAQEV